jgi:hypothetical protein
MREEGLSVAEEIEWFVASTGRARAIRYAWSTPAESAWASEPLRMAARGSRSCAIG